MREYVHPNTQNNVMVVRQGVNLSITPEGGETVTAELTQEQAIDIALALMYRAGARALRWCKNGDQTIEFFPVHPFEPTFNPINEAEKDALVGRI